MGVQVPAVHPGGDRHPVRSIQHGADEAEHRHLRGGQAPGREGDGTPPRPEQEHGRRQGRALHRIPELDNQLPETLQLVRSVLAALPCRVFSPITGSVCAWFDAGKSDAVAFRAELDALPLAEARVAGTAVVEFKETLVTAWVSSASTFSLPSHTTFVW